MSDNVYGFMKKWQHIDLGQVFTPLHMARFAAKLLDIKEGDSVLDSSAGSGALLMVSIERGASEVYGIEYDNSVSQLLEKNLNETGVKHEVLNADASSEEAAEWIKNKSITKALLNPPYEKKYNTFDILLNTLNSLPEGCLVALFYPTNHFEKMTKKQKAQMSNHRVEKIIVMPGNLFQPFVSVQTAIYIIRANTPQENYEFYGYKIEDDGLHRKKGKYREDTSGVWANELEPKFYDIISNETEDDISTRQNPSSGLMYQKPIDLTATHEDFVKTVSDYYEWKICETFKGHMDVNHRRLTPHIVLSKCQIMIAAMAYFTGSAASVFPVLDLMSKGINEEYKEGSEQTPEEIWEEYEQDCYTYLELTEKLTENEIKELSDGILQEISTNPDVVLGHIKLNVIHDGVFDFKAFADLNGGLTPIQKEEKPDFDYMEAYVLNVEDELTLGVIKYKEQFIKTLNEYKEEIEQIRKERFKKTKRFLPYFKTETNN